MSSNKTVMKSFRMSPNLAAQLSKAARKLGISETDYISKLLLKSMTLEPMYRKIGGIGMSKSLFQRIINQLDQSTLEIIASEIAQNNAPYAFELLDLELNQTSMIWFLREVLQNLEWFTFEELEHESIIELKLFHSFDEKWSLFLKSCLTSLFRLVHAEPEITTSERLVRVMLRKKSVFDFR